MKSTELKIGRVLFGAGYFFRNFNLGIQMSRYSAEINLGFFYVYLDWYNYNNLNLDWLKELDEEDFIDG